MHRDIVLTRIKWSCQMILKSHIAGRSYWLETNTFSAEANVQSLVWLSANCDLDPWASDTILPWEHRCPDKYLSHNLESHHADKVVGRT